MNGLEYVFNLSCVEILLHLEPDVMLRHIVVDLDRRRGESLLRLIRSHTVSLEHAILYLIVEDLVFDVHISRHPVVPITVELCEVGNVDCVVAFLQFIKPQEILELCSMDVQRGHGVLIFVNWLVQNGNLVELSIGSDSYVLLPVEDLLVNIGIIKGIVVEMTIIYWAADYIIKLLVDESHLLFL